MIKALYFITLFFDSTRLASHISGVLSEGIFRDVIAHLLLNKGVSHEAIVKLEVLDFHAITSLGYSFKMGSAIGIVNFLRHQYHIGLADAKNAIEVFAHLRIESERVNTTTSQVDELVIRTFSTSE